MIRFLAIIENTFREGIAKKTILTILILNTLIIGFFLIALGAAQDTLFIFGMDLEQAPEEVLRAVEAGIVAFFYQISIFIGVFAISSFFPNMQEKGTIDLLLSRPMSRFNIYLAKFIGCALVVLLIIGYLILGTWLVIGLKTGVYHIEYLYTIPVFMLIFAAFLGFVAMMGILSRNSTTSAVTTLFIPFLFSAILFGFHEGRFFRGNRFWYNFFEFFYNIFPKTVELTQFNIMIVRGRPTDTNLDFVIWSTLAFAAACFAVGALVFQKRSY